MRESLEGLLKGTKRLWENALLSGQLLNNFFFPQLFLDPNLHSGVGFQSLSYEVSARPARMPVVEAHSHGGHDIQRDRGLHCQWTQRRRPLQVCLLTQSTRTYQIRLLMKRSCIFYCRQPCL